LPTRQGFDEFFGYLDQGHAHNYFPTFLIRNERRVPLKNVVPNAKPSGAGIASVRAEYSADLIAGEALSFIDRQKDRRFFLYFAPTLPHANNEAGKKGMEIPDLGLYRDKDWPEPEKGRAAMISRLDSDVGRIFERLREHKIDDRTIVFFSSDNGPHAEGGSDAEFFNSNGPLTGFKRDLTEGGIRVPLVVRWPGHVPAGATSGHVGYFGDFLATVAELGGATEPSKTDGISFAPTLLSATGARSSSVGQQRRHEFLYWEFYERGSAQAARMGWWKAIAAPMGSGDIRLYDLEHDLAEERDVAARHPEVVAQMREIFQQSHVPSPLWTTLGGSRPPIAGAPGASTDKAKP
jgi:arylsulfatase A-like enzyme